VQRTAVFDLDGTLADTAADLIAAANACLEDFGIRLDPEADQATALGGGRAMLRLGLARAGRMDEALVDRLYPQLLVNYEAGIAVRTRLYDGVAGCLGGLLARDWALGVCTNKPAWLAELLLEKLGVRPAFRAVLGADSLPVRKPDPLHLLETIRLCGGTPARSVMVGDTITDRVTARNAGVACVLVTFGPGGEALRSLEPEALLAHFDDLPALLAGMMPA
jgi:phosphoglycolate phosphatase